MTEALGSLHDGVHVFPVRVYYEDTDAAGVVYYANYLRFAERARTDLLRIFGIEQTRLPVVFVVRRCNVEYRKPAHLDDLLEIHSRVIGMRAASVDIEQWVRRDGEDLVRLEVQVASVDMTAGGRPARMPPVVRESLKELTMQVSGY